MARIFADTNIFGIAVDPGDERREDIWKVLNAVSDGRHDLYTCEVVLAEIRDNPHGPTMEKELDLKKILVDDVFELTEDAVELSDKLVKETEIGIVDSEILATSIVNGCEFWTGDRELINESTVEEIAEVVEGFDPNLEFKYRVE